MMLLLLNRVAAARVLLFLTVVLSVVGQQDQCIAPKRSAPGKQKVFRIGVLAIRGVEIAYKDWNKTFSDYLSRTVGPRFDPPITFEMVPVAFPDEVIDVFGSGELDFVFANPGVYSCVESEVGANSLVTLVSRRRVNGNTFDLTQFGGVIFTRAEAQEIETISDIKGKRVGTVSLSGLGSGQMQFRELLRAGINYIQAPQQLILMENQNNVVKGVMTGQIDIGFVRTDQLERSVGNGLLQNLTQVRIIGARQDLKQDSGEPFPFQASTSLYPEWNLASLKHVSDDIAREVQASLLSVNEHAAIAPNLLSCYEERNCSASENDAECSNGCFASLDQSLFKGCDTNAKVALLAFEAMSTGRYAGWRSTLSYMELRNLQEETRFISLDPEYGSVRCIRSSEIADAVVCPPGHFKRSDEDITMGCDIAGLSCHGFQCICSPCVKAFDVDFSPVVSKNHLRSADENSGCAKFEVCGEVEQASTIRFRAVDNKKRVNATFSAHVIVGEDTKAYQLLRLEGNTTFDYVHEFTFDATSQPVGVVIIQVFVDDEQIPESPFRLVVLPRNCKADTGESRREPDATGQCLCATTSVEIGTKCVPIKILLPAILVPAAALAAVIVYFYVEQKKKQADTVWKVWPQKLIFKEPPRIIGRGTFGLVLLAEYRGTQVAVKRVIPPGTSNVRTSNFDFIDEEDCVRSRSAKRKQVAPSLGSQSVSSSDFDPQTGTRENFGVKSGFYCSTGPCSEAESRSRSRSTSSSSAPNRRLWWKQANSIDRSKLEKDFIKEMRLLSKLRHPCITTVMGAVVSRNFEPMLVMEYMELGSLYDLLHNESMVIEAELVLSIQRDVAQGLRFLHAANPTIVHGDVKSHNVLVDTHFRAKVADFGLSQKKRLRRNATGTPFWMAPELLRGESQNTPASDVYSFGIVIWETCTRKEPYEGENHAQVLRQVADTSINKRPPIHSSLSPEAAELMKACFQADPNKRPTAEHIDVRLRMTEAESEGIQISPRFLSGESQRTEDLLLQLFPRHVAMALRAGRKVEPESHECVTIFFADIVKYTTISAQLSPTKVSDMLDRLYTKFDQLCGSHNVFKVETVGDAYMAVTNLAAEQQDHVAIMAYFAFDAIDAASSTLIDEEEPSKGSVCIRVGIHSGPVVARVVGTRTPRYSLIGDTVNTASRMESLGKPERVHCSEESALILQTQCPQIDVVCRGNLHVKGKGEMITYWLRSPDTTGVSHRSVDGSLPIPTKAGPENNQASIAPLEDEHSKQFYANTSSRETVTAVPEAHPESNMTSIHSSKEQPNASPPASKASSIRQDYLAPIYDYLRSVYEPPENTERGLAENNDDKDLSPDLRFQ